MRQVAQMHSNITPQKLQAMTNFLHLHTGPRSALNSLETTARTCQPQRCGVYHHTNEMIQLSFPSLITYFLNKPARRSLPQGLPEVHPVGRDRRRRQPRTLVIMQLTKPHAGRPRGDVRLSLTYFRDARGQSWWGLPLVLVALVWAGWA